MNSNWCPVVLRFLLQPIICGFQARNIEKELKSLKVDNSKLVRTLQDTLELNEQLRAQVNILEGTIATLGKEKERITARW